MIALLFSSRPIRSDSISFLIMFVVGSVVHVPKLAPLRNAMPFTSVTGGSLVTDARHTTPRKILQSGKLRSSFERLRGRWSVTDPGYRHEESAVMVQHLLKSRNRNACSYLSGCIDETLVHFLSPINPVWHGCSPVPVADLNLRYCCQHDTCSEQHVHSC